MGTAYDLVISGTITIMMFVFHRVGVELFAPGSALWETATRGTAAMSGEQHASTLFQVIVVWMPLLFIGAVWAWTMVRAYKRQIQTAARPA
jgi:hypothetical protein